MQHIVEFAFSSFQKWGHIDPNRSGIGLIKQLNAENGSTITTGMVHTSSFPSYKYHIKNEVINNYSVFCNIDKCHVCRK